MKIAYHANARIPSLTANSVQIMKMCAAFAAAGHDVTLIVPRFDRRLPTPATLSRHYGVPIDFRIVWLRGWRTFGRLWFERRAAAHARRQRADLYMTRNERLAARLTAEGRPTVLELHQPPRKQRDVQALRALPQHAALRALVVISSSLRTLLLEQQPAFHSANVVVEHDGVDLERFPVDISPAQARAALGWREAGLVAGYAGHLYAGRGMDTILHLAEHQPHVAFRIIGGDAAAVARLREDVAVRGLDNVELLGFVANADLPRYLQACDMLLMPYARSVITSGGGETAGFASPLKMFEYMAADRLIIGSRLSGVAEVLNDGNSILCEPDDLHAWNAAVQRAHDPSLRTRLAARARTDVEHYTWSRRARRILDAAALP